MRPAEKSLDLLHELGALALERLRALPFRPPGFVEVAKLEREVQWCDAEIDRLEAELNSEDAGYARFVRQVATERARCQKIMEQWEPAVAAIRRRTHDFERELANSQGQQRHDAKMLAQLEAEYLELQTNNPYEKAKLEAMKKQIVSRRLALMRAAQNLDEKAGELKRMLLPEPGHPGAKGILAYRRDLELEREEERRKQEFAALMGALDQEIVAREKQLQSATQRLDDAVMALAEECYAARVADPVLAPMMAKLARLRRD